MNSFSIEDFLDLSGYATPERIARRKNVTIGPGAHEQTEGIKAGKKAKPTAEYFTPYSIVKRMGDKIPDEDWANPDKTFLEPSFGNGQFVCYIVWNRIEHGVSWERVLDTLYGVELMQDNVDETKGRVIDLLKQMSVDFDEAKARETMDRNLVCHDFFDWDFARWKPMNIKLF